MSLFAPGRELLGDPSRYQIPFEEVIITTETGLELHGWYVDGSGSTVLWLHGNAGNISDRLDILAEMTRKLNVSSLLFDYRGYGKSGGKPSIKGLNADSIAAMKWLEEEKGTDPGSVVVYGHSLGSVIAIDLAIRKEGKIGGLVLESPLTSARDMARELYYGLPVDLLMSLKLDNIGKIGKISTPLLVIHGDADEVIPFRMGRELFESAHEPKKFLSIPGAGHSDCFIVGGESYWNAWKEFLVSSF